MSCFQRCPTHPTPSMKCADTSLIYCIICNKCGKLYVGLTSNSLKVHFRAHRYFSKTKRLIPLYRHFARKSHDFLRDHKIVPLEHCEPDALPVREAYWIRTLHTLIPHGLNSAYGKPFYPYDHSLLPPSPPTAGTPPRNTTKRLFIMYHPLCFVRAGFLFSWVFQRDFPTGFFTSGFPLEDVGQHPPKSIAPSSLHPCACSKPKTR